MRIAVVGAGLIGRRHAEIVQGSSRAELTGVADPAAGDWAREQGIGWYPGLDALLDDAPIDGAIIATPNRMHVEHGLACLRAGVPVLIEKPIADTAESALRLVEASEAAGLPVLVGHHRRHNPLIAAAKARIDSGALGDLVAVHASCWLYKPDDYFDVAWRREKGAGPVFINLIHDVDLLRYLAGEIATVQALESNRTRGHAVEDSAAILLGFANGALGTVSVSDTVVAPWSWELTAAENPAYPATGQSCYLIGGTHGSLEVPTGRLWSQPGERSWWRPIDSTCDKTAPADPLLRQLEHFCDVIAGDAVPLVTGREALKSLQVIEAIKRAAETGERVAVGDGNPFDPDAA